MNSKPIKGLIGTLFVLLWFHSVSLLIGIVIQFITRQPIEVLNQHTNLINLACYFIIFVGIFTFDDKREEFLNAIKPRKLFTVKTILYILMGIGTYFIGILIISQLIQYFPDYEEINETFNEYEPRLRFFLIVVAAPFLEEYLFRHKIQGLLKESFNIPIAIIGQALCFGLLHYYNLQKIYATVIGLIFGCIKEKKGIQATIWMHMTVNFIGWCIGNFLQ